MISELQPNQTIRIVALISGVTQGISPNKSTYLKVLFQDKSGIISGRLWDASPDDIKQLVVGQVAEVEASSLLYNAELQLKISGYTILADAQAYRDELVHSAPIDIDKAFSDIMEIINGFSNTVLKRVMNALFEQHGKAFKESPAAIRMHHAVQGGLVWHTFTMLEMAKSVVKIYDRVKFDQDLLFAGVIMHDFGKVIELSNNNAISSYTLNGRLLGHISIACGQIMSTAEKLSIPVTDESLVLLQHLVLSSHGKYEFGSPVLPYVLEAEILHTIDNLDARIYAIDEIMKTVKPGEFSHRIAIAENRMFYKINNKK